MNYRMTDSITNSLTERKTQEQIHMFDMCECIFYLLNFARSATKNIKATVNVTHVAYVEHNESNKTQLDMLLTNDLPRNRNCWKNGNIMSMSGKKQGGMTGRV